MLPAAADWCEYEGTVTNSERRVQSVRKAIDPPGLARPDTHIIAGLAGRLGQVRDYGRCIMCYKCVKACGTDAQFTFAIPAAGRGFDARIATELNNPLPDSACVYCGNCIGVCPTGALKSVRQHELREADDWERSTRPSPPRSARSAGSAATSSYTCSRGRPSTSPHPRTTP